MRLELSTGCISDATSVAEKATGNLGEEAEARAEQGRVGGKDRTDGSRMGGIGEQWGATEDKENRVSVSTFTISSEV